MSLPDDGWKRREKYEQKEIPTFTLIEWPTLKPIRPVLKAEDYLKGKP